MLGNGIGVSVSDAVITAKTGAIGPNFFYVETPEQSSGIRVDGTTSLAIGTHVDIVGAMTTHGVERAIIGQATPTTPPSSEPVAPVGINTAAAGGCTTPPLMGPTGAADSIPLDSCVNVFGSVTAGAQSNEFIVNDGGRPDGILCRAATGAIVPTSGYYAVTGVISLETAGSDRIPVILINNADSDIVPLN